MYQWELDGPALQEFGDLPPHAPQALAAFMDTVVIVDPVEYQRRHDEPSSQRKTVLDEAGTGGDSDHEQS